MDSATMFDVFDGARMVAFSDDCETVAVWCGGLTVNLYHTDTGKNFDCYTLEQETQWDAQNVQTNAIEHMRGED